jgi:hypothetical protein
MTQEFIPYEQALALKELGFDEPCFGYFDKEDDNTLYFDVCYETKNLAAPLYQQAFRWFRERYQLFGEVIMYIPQEGDLDGYFTYVFLISTVENYKKKPKVDELFYSSSEKAELACLKKLIEIVKNK